MVLGALHGHRLAHGVAAADDDAQLQLEVQARGGLQHGGRGVRRLDLAARAHEGRPGGHHRGRTAVVADRHPLVVRQQRVVRAEQLAHRRGVVDADVEVGVVADLAGQAQLHGGLRMQRRLPSGLLRAALAQSARERQAQGPALRGRQRQQAGHVGMVDQAGGAQVQHLVADGNADAPAILGMGAEAAERQVLQGEVAAGDMGAGHPAAQRGVVGLVERMGHGVQG